jgi:ribosomal protein S18 acetylase RimI-like enzyme
MLTIGPGTGDDLGALIALDPIAQRSPDRRDAIAEWLAAGQCHIARLDGRPAGYVALTTSFFRSPFIEMLMVAEWSRRQGVGRALIAHCLAVVPAGDKLWTSTNESNTPMRALLPQLGFVHTGQFEGLDDGDPELIYLHH